MFKPLIFLLLTNVLASVSASARTYVYTAHIPYIQTYENAQETHSGTLTLQFIQEPMADIENGTLDIDAATSRKLVLTAHDGPYGWQILASQTTGYLGIVEGKVTTWQIDNLTYINSLFPVPIDVYSFKLKSLPAGDEVEFQYGIYSEGVYQSMVTMRGFHEHPGTWITVVPEPPASGLAIAGLGLLASRALSARRRSGCP